MCFITPPSPFLLDERVFPALGVIKVAAVAEQLGYTVEHLDLNGVVNYEEAVATHLIHTSARVFALTATTPQMVSTDKIRKVIRGIYPLAKLVIGGPHPTLVHAASKTSKRAGHSLAQLLGAYDMVVAGDGELCIEHAIEAKYNGLIDADDPRTELFMTKEQLNRMPWPARHLVDLHSYKYNIDGVAVTSIISQLGCPFGCNFCAGRDSAMLRRTRLRSTDSVLGEMRHIAEVYGIYGFMFFDDELNVNPNVLELLRGIDTLQKDLGVEFRCRGFVKSELFNEYQAAAMYRAGFRRVMCGFESGSDRILRNINKRATKANNTEAMRISHAHGLGMKALMSVGHAGESKETIQDTEDWLLQVRPDDFDVTIITAYPGSPYYDKAVMVTPVVKGKDVWVFETNGDRLYMEDIDYTTTEDFYKGSLDSYKSYVFTDYLAPDEIVQLRDKVERTVRGALGIPFYVAGKGVQFESSMGMLPSSVYRSTNTSTNVEVKQ